MVEPVKVVSGLVKNTMPEHKRKEERKMLQEQQFDIVKYQNNFLNYIDVSQKTIDTYRMALKQFINWLNQEEVILPVREDVIRYRESLKARCSLSTINSYLIAVRNFFKWLEYEGLYKNITQNIKGFKIDQRHKKESLTTDQVKVILDHAENIREKVLFSLMVTTGLRANEVVNIKISDFKEQSGVKVLHVLGKGRQDKTDYVKINDTVFEMLQEYVKVFLVKDFLFYSTSKRNNGCQLTTKTIRLIIKDMYKRAGYDSDMLTCHSTRHTFANLSIQNGAELREVSNALRHKSINTTMIYLKDIEGINNPCGDIVGGIIWN